MPFPLKRLHIRIFEGRDSLIKRYTWFHYLTAGGTTVPPPADEPRRSEPLKSAQVIALDWIQNWAYPKPQRLVQLVSQCICYLDIVFHSSDVLTLTKQHDKETKKEFPFFTAESLWYQKSEAHGAFMRQVTDAYNSIPGAGEKEFKNWKAFRMAWKNTKDLILKSAKPVMKKDDGFLQSMLVMKSPSSGPTQKTGLALLLLEKVAQGVTELHPYFDKDVLKVWQKEFVKRREQTGGAFDRLTLQALRFSKEDYDVSTRFQELSTTDEEVQAQLTETFTRYVKKYGALGRGDAQKHMSLSGYVGGWQEFLYSAMNDQDTREFSLTQFFSKDVMWRDREHFELDACVLDRANYEFIIQELHCEDQQGQPIRPEEPTTEKFGREFGKGVSEGYVGDDGSSSDYEPEDVKAKNETDNTVLWVLGAGTMLLVAMLR